MRISFTLACLLALSAVSCTPRSSPPGGTGADPAFSSDAYCAIATTDGLYDWTGNAMVACPGLMVGSGDEPTDGSSCTVSTIDAGGALHATTLSNTQGAQVLSDGRILVWSFDGSLTIRNAGMPSVTIADVALDPWLDPTRNRVAFIAPAVGATTLEAGDDRRVVLYDIPTQTTIEVVGDSQASSPVLVPGTDTVLYVSSSSDTAAVWRVVAPTIAASDDPIPDSCADGRAGDPTDPNNGCPPADTTMSFAQITNLTPDIPQTNDPTFGRQHVFVGDTSAPRLVYAANVTQPDGSIVSEVFALDPATGTTMDLGPGSYPQRGPSGSVLARTGTTNCVAVQYLAPGATP